MTTSFCEHCSLAFRIDGRRTCDGGEDFYAAIRKSPLRILAGEGASFPATGTGGEGIVIDQLTPGV